MHEDSNKANASLSFHKIFGKAYIKKLVRVWAENSWYTVSFGPVPVLMVVKIIWSTVDS